MSHPDALPRLAPWGLVAVGLVVALLTFADYGPTPDDAIQATYGELALAYFATGGADRSADEYLDLRYYGPLVEMIPALVWGEDRPGRFETRHLVLGLVALLVVPAVWGYARRFGLPVLPLFAVLAVCTQPRFYGHWFNNSKDAPFAIAMVWYLLTLAGLVNADRWRWRQALLCGAAMGLTACVRPGGFPVLLLFLGGALVIRYVPGGAGPEPRPPRRDRLGELWAQLAVTPVVAWIVMVAPWPWAHAAPIAHPLEAMRVAGRFPTTMPILFDGRTWPSDGLPWFYIPKYVLIGTPLGLLALALIGLLFAVRAAGRERRPRESRMALLTLLWLFVPLGLFALLRPNVYGGMRHFLFVLPPLGILAGYGAARLLAAVPRRRRVVVGIALGVVLLLPVRHLVRLHPYQISYYNALVGGVGGASERYWTDYGMTSYRAAIEWVNQRAAATPERPVRAALAAGPPVMLWARDYAAPNVELVALRDVPPHERRGAFADYYIGTTRLGTDRAFPDAPIVHSIGRDGAVFTVVRRLTDPTEPL